MKDRLEEARKARSLETIRKDIIVLNYVRQNKTEDGLTCTEIAKATGFKRSFVLNSVLRLERYLVLKRTKKPDKYFAKLINHWFPS